MNSLYPEILFHFTTKDGFFNILKDTFKVSYASEQICGDEKSTEFLVPMVSFCDLKLSEVKGHMKKYGKFGIGLSKEWANREGLNPVFYVNKDSHFTSNLINTIEKLSNHISSTNDNDEDKSISEEYMDIFNISRYIKNYQGILTRKNKPIVNDYRFADEREWRYVPEVNNTRINLYL